MKRYIIAAIIIVAAAGLIWKGIYLWQQYRGIGPAILPSPRDITKEIANASNETDFPLTLPEGFTIEVFAEGIADARVLLFDQAGSLWVSQRSQGKVTKLTIEDGAITLRESIDNLNGPHGLALDPDDANQLYIAEEDTIIRHDLSTNVNTPIVGLPAGGGHSTRTLLFHPDGRLLVAIGSSCNVCGETDQRRAAVYVLNKDGSDFKPFSTGLRNAVFLTQRPGTDEIWVTEMGRDHLGDDVPPDEVNVLTEGAHYGWPYCYGQNVLDRNFDANATCADRLPARVDLQAHSAPLGLAFVPTASGWPKEYEGDLIVAFHGSWNRSVPTGYKLVRIEFDDSGKSTATHDFITGWLVDSGALGRPTGLTFGPDGALYVADDKAGVIYRVTYSAAETAAARDGCVITGCSGQLCADEEMFSTCEFRPEYSCYKTATCERQADGTCGWTPTDALATCLANPPAL